jgi:hypothetical protein
MKVKPVLGILSVINEEGKTFTWAQSTVTQEVVGTFVLMCCFL